MTRSPRTRTWFALGLLLVAARAPWLLSTPRLLAEEVTVYLDHALTHPPAEALFAPHQGYYQLWTNAAAVLAARLGPIEHAPWFLLAFALLGTASLVAAVAASPAPWLHPPPARAAALAVLALAPSSSAVWMSAGSLQYMLPAGVVLLLLEGSAPSGRSGNWARRGFIASAALNGGMCALLTPLVLLRWLRGCSETRRRSSVFLLSVLLHGALVAVAADPADPAGVRERFAVPHPAELGLGLLATFAAPATLAWLVPSGPGLRDFWTAPGGAGGWLALPAAGLLAAALRRSAPAATLGAAALLLYVASAAFAAGDRQARGVPMPPARYSYGAEVLFLFALVAAAGSRAGQPGGWRRPVLAALAGAFLASGAREALPPRGRHPAIAGGPSWTETLEAQRRDPGSPAPIWPRGWSGTIRHRSLHPAAFWRIEEAADPLREDSIQVVLTAPRLGEPVRILLETGIPGAAGGILVAPLDQKRDRAGFPPPEGPVLVSAYPGRIELPFLADAEGRAEISLLLASDASYLGRTYVLQAVVREPRPLLSPAFGIRPGY